MMVVPSVLSPLPTLIPNPSDLWAGTPVRKKNLATYIKPGKALSIRVEDIGRRRVLTQPRLAGSCR
jgi:hypothetical protein